jgi:hypothetical protein
MRTFVLCVAALVAAGPGAAATGGRTAVYTAPVAGADTGSVARTFASRCFGWRGPGTHPGFGGPPAAPGGPFVGRLKLPWRPKVPTGYLSISWRGLYATRGSDLYGGTGSGTWQATGLPPSCRRGGRTTAHGRVLLTFLPTRSGEVARVTLLGFSP